ncbi:MAG: hypothetical protein QOF91_2282, partial [Alphaproteobacteria bacterium]|nr:hypothetical protein [Alphaproteobacteria bacterium]
EETHHRKLALRHSGRFDMDKQDITYRTATAADVDTSLRSSEKSRPKSQRKLGHKRKSWWKAG